MMVTCEKEEVTKMKILYLAVFFFWECFNTGKQVTIFANSVSEADDVTEQGGSGDRLE